MMKFAVSWNQKLVRRMPTGGKKVRNDCSTNGVFDDALLDIVEIKIDQKLTHGLPSTHIFHISKSKQDHPHV
jgi:hypothetical protein